MKYKVEKRPVIRLELNLKETQYLHDLCSKSSVENDRALGMIEADACEVLDTLSNAVSDAE